MVKRGIIGNWQHTKYVSRETSGGIGIGVSTRWGETEWQDTAMTWNPESNVRASIYGWISPLQGVGKIERWLYPDFKVNAGTDIWAVCTCVACYNVLNTLPVSDSWEQGITQRVVNQEYEDYFIKPTLTLPNQYRNGVEPLSAFEIDDGGLYFYDLANQTVFSATFQGTLIWSGDRTAIEAPAIEWGDGVNTIRTSGSYRDGRAYYIIDWYFIFSL